MKKKIRFPMVEVTWFDAWSGRNHWHEPNPKEKVAQAIVYTVGFLIAKTPKYVRVALSYSPDDTQAGSATGECINNEFLIPTGMIKKIRKLK